MGKRPTQSRALPGPFEMVTVSVPPGAIVAGVAATAVGCGVPFCTVIGALVARSDSESFEKNRRLYVPAFVGSLTYMPVEKKRTLYAPVVEGIANVNVADVTGMTGATREPFRYFQSSIDVSGALAE